jgi:hypothetical protein
VAVSTASGGSVELTVVGVDATSAGFRPQRWSVVPSSTGRDASLPLPPTNGDSGRVVRRTINWAAIDDGLRALECIATHGQMAELGLTSSTLMRRISPRGPWQRILPGVVLAHRGTPTRREQIRAALAFCGTGAIVTGVDALRAHGLRTSMFDSQVDVLIPAEQHRKSFGFVRVERTRRPPVAVVINGIPYAPVARAVVDACRRTRTLDGVRDLVSTAIQQRACTVAELRREILSGARQRSALSRLVLAEISEGKAREVLRAQGVRAPAWNVHLYRPDGTKFLSPDAYWADVAAAIEIDSFAWHLKPADYMQTMRRARRMTIGGVLVLPFAPTEIIDAPEAFAQEVEALLRVAAARPVPEGIVVRATEAA